MKALNVATISDNKIFIIIKICQISIKLKNTVFKNFTKIISKENLGTELKNKVIILGVPSYTSGAQKKKKKTVNLNKRLQ